MSKEIEIRYKLNNKESLIKWLNKSAHMIGTSHHIDTYYNNKFNSFIKDTDHIYKWLRIRKEDSNITLNYKHWLPEGQIIRTYCDEYELQLSSSETMEEILIKLGFEVFIIVDKWRSIWKYKDCEIAIDSVVTLGDYIEIEYKGKNENDIQSINEYLHNVLKELPADIGEEDFGGYGFKLIKMKYN